MKYDLTGKRFGRLVVISQSTKKDSSKAIYWHCKCDCGAEKDVRASTLLNGTTRSCGCLRKERAGRASMVQPGMVFGHLTAIRPLKDERFRGQIMWECKCDCGNICKVASYNLTSENTKSCGCRSAKKINMFAKNGLTWLIKCGYGGETVENALKLLEEGKINGEKAYRYAVFLSSESDPDHKTRQSGFWTGAEYYYDYYMHPELVKKPEHGARVYADKKDAENALESCLKRGYEDVLSGKVMRVTRWIESAEISEDEGGSDE